jgi:tyrosine-specific transport protein
MNFSRYLTASALVSGTCIGGGILALPLETGPLGFWPSALILVICYLFMTLTGLLYAQASMWMKGENAHVVSIAKHLLGRTGEWIAVILYLFMGYASLVAYNSGGALLVKNFFQYGLSYDMAGWLSSLVYAVVFGVIFYFGPRVLGWINTLLVCGLVVAYILMVSVGLDDVRSTLLARTSFKGSGFVFPLLLTSFSFQMIVPSIALYVEHDVKALKYSIITGTTLTLCIYLLWQFVVLGIVPVEGEHGLSALHASGSPVTEGLKYFTKSNFVSKIAELFAFFAIVTSYLGIGLGLYDFLADLFSVQKKGWGKFLLVLLVSVPTLYFTLIYPQAFISALDITGGLGDTILNGVIPALMVWVGTYVIGHENREIFIGGRAVLTLLILFSIFVFTMQVIQFFN